MLHDVLQGLQDAEVRCRLHLLRVAAEPVRVHVDGQQRSTGLRPQGRHQPLIGEHRRVDPAREVAELAERLLRVGLEGRRSRAVAVSVASRSRSPNAPPPARPAVAARRRGGSRSSRRRSSSCARHDPLAGGLVCQLLDQRDVPEHEPGLGTEVVEQLVLLGRERIALALRQRERAEQLAVVSHRDRAGAPEPRGSRRSAGDVGDARRLGGRHGGAVQYGPDPRARPRLREPRFPPRGSASSVAAGRRRRRSTPCSTRSSTAPRRAWRASRRRAGSRSAGRARGPAGTGPRRPPSPGSRAPRSVRPWCRRGPIPTTIAT